LGRGVKTRADAPRPHYGGARSLKNGLKDIQRRVERIWGGREGSKLQPTQYKHIHGERSLFCEGNTKAPMVLGAGGNQVEKTGDGLGVETQFFTQQTNVWGDVQEVT